ncbi:MAG: type II secretion system protein [Patescibacteria group bacterium]
MLKASPGFTLVELLISISILSGMTYISVQKFKTIEQNDSLSAGAARVATIIRKAQNLAQSGKQTQYPLANGYGVRIEKAAGANLTGSALLFVDLNSSDPVHPNFAGLWKWDASILAPATAVDRQIDQTVSPDITAKNIVVIDTVTVGVTSVAGADVFYHTPDALGRIDGTLVDDRVVITLKNKKTNKTKDVIVSRISGRVEIGP